MTLLDCILPLQKMLDYSRKMKQNIDKLRLDQTLDLDSVDIDIKVDEDDLQETDVKMHDSDAILQDSDANMPDADEQPQSVSPQLIENSEEENELLDNYVPDDEYRKNVRKSISALLDVRGSITLQNEEISGGTKNKRLHQRLNKISMLYVDEDASAKQVLSEQKTNVAKTCDFLDDIDPLAGSRKRNIKDKLRELAESYYPIETKSKNESKPASTKTSDLLHSKSSTIVQTKTSPTRFQSVAFQKAHSNAIVEENLRKPSQIKKNQASIVEKKESVQTQKAASPKVITKKISVADLKKVFESNISAEEKPQKAPETLTFREKTKLFEKIAKDEASAKLNSRRSPIKRKVNVDMFGAQVAKKQSLDDNPDNEPVFQNSPEMPDQHEGIQVEDVKPDEITVEPQAPDIVVQQETENLVFEDQASEIVELNDNDDEMLTQAVVPEEDSEDLVDQIDEFELNESMEQEDDNEANLTFSELEKDHPEGTLCSSTIGPEIESACSNVRSSSNDGDVSNQFSMVTNFEEEFGPSKPPRLYLYENADEPTNTVPMKTISFYRREQKMRNEAEAHELECLTSYASSSTAQSDLTHQAPQVIRLKQKLQPDDQIDFEEFKRVCAQKIEDLKDEILEHQRIAQQASTALNMCLSLPEMVNHEGRVEAERLLLISGTFIFILGLSFFTFNCR